MARLDPRLKNFLYERQKGTVNVGFGIQGPPDIVALVNKINTKHGIPGVSEQKMPFPCFYAHEGIDGCVNHKVHLWTTGFKDAMKVISL